MNLSDEWTLYDHSKSVKNYYDQNIRKIGTMTNVRDFKNIFMLYPGIENLFHRRIDKTLIKPFIIVDNNEREVSAVSLFKRNIQPQWEHIDNQRGGEIQVKFMESKGQNIISTEDLDAIWYKIILFTVTNRFSCYDSINGIRIIDHTDNTDKFILAFRIEIWFSEIDDNSIKKLDDEIRLLINGNIKTVVKMHRPQ